MILGHVARKCLWAYIANMVLASESWAYFDPNRNGRLDRVWLSLLLGHSFFLFLKFFSNRNFRPSTSRKSTLSLHFRGIDFDDSSMKWIIRWVNCWRENGLNFSLVRDRKTRKKIRDRRNQVLIFRTSKVWIPNRVSAKRNFAVFPTHTQPHG